MRLNLAINPYRREYPINYRRDSFTTKWTIIIQRWLNTLVPPCIEAEDTKDSDNWEQWTRIISVGDVDKVYTCYTILVNHFKSIRSFNIRICIMLYIHIYFLSRYFFTLYFHFTLYFIDLAIFMS